jgi:hypothetical protein
MYKLISDKSWIHSVGAIIRNSLKIEDDHLRSTVTSADAIELIRKHVEQIELETTSYCNRTCAFCPNSFIDRLSEKRIMPEVTWETILDGLREIEYSGAVVWSRYSEPLSERRILERLRQVREAAPNSRIRIYSNGDFLDADYLRELEKAGLDSLWVDVYFPDDEVYETEAAVEYHERFLERIGRSATLFANDTELCYRIDSDRTEIVSHVRNMAAMKAMNLGDRGGLIKLAVTRARVAPCFMPYKNIVIDWDGSVVICCHVRSDSPSHKSAVVGRIGVNGLGLPEAYICLAGWRRALRGYGPKKGPCENCNVAEYTSNGLTRFLSQWLANPKAPVRTVVKSGMRPALTRRLRY